MKKVRLNPLKSFLLKQEHGVSFEDLIIDGTLLMKLNTQVGIIKESSFMNIIITFGRFHLFQKKKEHFLKPYIQVVN